MSKTYIPSSLRQAVAERAEHHCSYCLTPEEIIGAPFTIDHIIPESLGGPTTIENLCLACWSCNSIKQARLVAYDSETNQTLRLFNPNTQKWPDHFIWQENGLLIRGLTATGRVTVNVLKLNRSPLVKSTPAEYGYVLAYIPLKIKHEILMQASGHFFLKKQPDD